MSSTATAISKSWKNPVEATISRTAAASEGRGSARKVIAGWWGTWVGREEGMRQEASRHRGAEDALDCLGECDAGAGHGGRETGVGGEAGVGVDLQDPRSAVFVAAEI